MEQITDRLYSRTDFCVSGDYFCVHLDADIRKHGFRHSGREAFAGRWCCTSDKPAMDDGHPARLVRDYPAVTDDFGNLVEV